MTENHPLDTRLAEAGARLRRDVEGATEPASGLVALRGRRRRVRAGLAALALVAVILSSVSLVGDDRPRGVVTGPTPARPTSGPTRVYGADGRQLFQYREGIDPAMAHVADAVRRLAVTDPDLRTALLVAIGRDGDSTDTAALDRAFLDAGLQIDTAIVPARQRALHDVVRAGLGTLAPDAAVTVVHAVSGDVEAIYGGRLVGTAGFSLPFEQRRQLALLTAPFDLVAGLEAGVGADEVLQVDNTAGGPRVLTGDDAAPRPASMAQGLAEGTLAPFVALQQRIGDAPILAARERVGLGGSADRVDDGSRAAGILDAADTTTAVAAAYAVLAGDGRRRPPRFIVRITDRAGDVVYDPAAGDSRPAGADIPAAAARTVRNLLAENPLAKVDGRRAFGTSATGQENRDAWFAGVVDELSIAVWVGFTASDTIRPMRPPATPAVVTGRTVPARIWHDAAVALLAKRDR